MSEVWSDDWRDDSLEETHWGEDVAEGDFPSHVAFALSSPLV